MVRTHPAGRGVSNGALPEHASAVALHHATQIARNAARDEAAQRKAARRASTFLAKRVAWYRTFLTAQVTLGALVCLANTEG